MEGVLAMGVGVLVLFVILYALDKVVLLAPPRRITR